MFDPHEIFGDFFFQIVSLEMWLLWHPIFFARMRAKSAREIFKFLKSNMRVDPHEIFGKKIFGIATLEMLDLY